MKDMKEQLKKSKERRGDSQLVCERRAFLR